MARPTSLKPGRKPNSGRPSLATTSPACRQLSPHEVAVERAALAADMLGLLQDDGGLSRALQGRVEVLCEALVSLYLELRSTSV